MKIYVASAWTNQHHDAAVLALRGAHHQVYDYRQPDPHDPKNVGFSWADIGKHWHLWTAAEYKAALKNPLAMNGYKCQARALNDCDACVLVLPAGASAHAAFGLSRGLGRRTFVLVPPWGLFERELMHLSAERICASVGELVAALREPPPAHAPAEVRDPSVAIADVPGLASALGAPPVADAATPEGDA